MSDPENEINNNYELLLHKIQTLEKRLSGIESLLRVEWVNKEEDENPSPISDNGNTAERAESKIVEYGLAWLGTIVFLFGIIFLMSYVESLGYFISSRVIAYVSTFLLISISYFFRNSFPILVNVLDFCSPLLLYFITVRLHFFSDQPVISQKEIVIVLLLIRHMIATAALC